VPSLEISVSGPLLDRDLPGTDDAGIRVALGRRLDGLWEAAVIGTLYVAYELVRSLAPGREAMAFRNAHAIYAVESALHLNVELPFNRALTPFPALADVVNVYYQLAHETVALAVLLALWRYRRRVYPVLRTTLVLITLGAVIMYWVLPVAPPRMALAGTVDTVSTRPGVLAAQSPMAGLVNLYAAMPSLHVAWAVWCALAVVIGFGGRWRHLAWIYPAVTTVVVLITANHYVLDIIAGVVLAATAWYLTVRILPATMAVVRRRGAPPWPDRRRSALH
jgi:hypothetical protein